MKWSYHIGRWQHHTIDKAHLTIQIGMKMSHIQQNNKVENLLGH